MTRVCVLDDHFREDLEHWVSTDRKTAIRILKLMEAVLRDPFDGIGKPERLKHLDSDTWSRRITQEHRLVYHVAVDRVTFLQALMTYQRNRSGYRKKGYRPPSDFQRRILEHIRYERNMLDHAARSVEDTFPLINISEDYKALYFSSLESFLIHARNLRDFLYKTERENAKPSDVLARDFFSDPAEWHRMRPISNNLNHIANGLNLRVGRYVVHLSYDRIKPTPDLSSWDIGSIFKEVDLALGVWKQLAEAENPDFDWDVFNS